MGAAIVGGAIGLGASALAGIGAAAVFTGTAADGIVNHQIPKPTMMTARATKMKRLGFIGLLN
jgi:hypothetical protein